VFLWLGSAAASQSPLAKSSRQARGAITTV
jgi:hypothetical protein